MTATKYDIPTIRKQVEAIFGGIHEDPFIQMQEDAGKVHVELAAWFHEKLNEGHDLANVTEAAVSVIAALIGAMAKRTGAPPVVLLQMIASYTLAPADYETATGDLATEAQH